MVSPSVKSSAGGGAARRPSSRGSPTARSRRLRVPLALLAACLLVPSLASCGGGQRYESFEALVSDYFGADFALRGGGDFGLDRLSVRTVGGEPFGRALAVDYPAGSASKEVTRESGAPGGGAQFYLTLRQGPGDAARLVYYVRFPQEFDFVKGGKLPGLFGGRATAGGRTPDGTDGFSTRFMWRSGGDGEVYAYLPQSRDVGTSLGRGVWKWPTGRWLRVEQEVHLNAVGKEDGLIVVRIDGQEVYRAERVTFRDTGDVRIDGLFFSTFFGGGDPSWASPVDQSAEFADFSVTRL